MRGTSRIVDLHQAFWWACEDCGRDNFARAIQLEPESVEAVELSLRAVESFREAEDQADSLGAELEGAFVMSPSHVKCTHCGAEFSTRDED